MMDLSPGLYEYYDNLILVVRVSRPRFPNNYIVVEGIMTGPLRRKFVGLEEIFVQREMMMRL